MKIKIDWQAPIKLKEGTGYDFLEIEIDVSWKSALYVFTRKFDVISIGKGGKAHIHDM